MLHVCLLQLCHIVSWKKIQENNILQMLNFHAAQFSHRLPNVQRLLKIAQFTFSLSVAVLLSVCYNSAV